MKYLGISETTCAKHHLQLVNTQKVQFFLNTFGKSKTKTKLDQNYNGK